QLAPFWSRKASTCAAVMEVPANICASLMRVPGTKPPRPAGGVRASEPGAAPRTPAEAISTASTRSARRRRARVEAVVEEDRAGAGVDMRSPGDGGSPAGSLTMIRPTDAQKPALTSRYAVVTQAGQ